MQAITIRDRLITNGVKALNETGYPGATCENILTDEIYRAFFVVALTVTLVEFEHRAKSGGAAKRSVEAVRSLIEELTPTESQA